MITTIIFCDRNGCKNFRNLSPLDIDVFDRRAVHAYFRGIGWITENYDHLCPDCRQGGADEQAMSSW